MDAAMNPSQLGSTSQYVTQLLGSGPPVGSPLEKAARTSGAMEQFTRDIAASSRNIMNVPC